ncbi:MAG: CDP-alcohol phosphatidyltransferase family protein [Desulfosoma sp.]
MTIPNLLTLLRILLTPLLVWLLLNERLTGALTVFFLAGITDGLDGFIARVFHQKSRLGAYLDPLADKILLVTSFILLGHLTLVPNALVIVAVSRDLLILTGVMTFWFFQIPLEIRPSLLSKLTTLAQIVTVLLTLSQPLMGWSPTVRKILYALTGLITVASGLHYTVLGFRIWERGRPAGTDGLA